MKDKNLKRLFKIAAQEGIDLRYLEILEIPTKEQFFIFLPADSEHNELISDSNIDVTLKAYLAFNKFYCIDNEGNTYLIDEIDEAYVIHNNNIKQWEENQIKILTENSKQSAFPLKEPLSDDTLRLTKREYFAGLAMQGLASAIWVDCNATNCAKKAVEYADALLKQLENQP